MKKIFLLVCLPLLLLAACSKPSDINEPEGGGDVPSGDWEGNVENPVTFQSFLLPITRSGINEQSVSEASLYAWSGKEKEVRVASSWETYTALTNLLYYNFTVVEGIMYYAELTPAHTTLTRSADDPTLWNCLHEVSWNDYQEDSLAFMALSGVQDNLTISGAKGPLTIKRDVPYSEYDSVNKEYYYASGSLHDLMGAYTWGCKPGNYEIKNAKGEVEGYKPVELVFNHVLPRVCLNAKLGEINALDVEISEAYIFGLQVNGSQTVSQEHSFGEAWKGSSISPLQQYIQMDLKNSVKLTSEYQSLVDEGSEPHVVPQKVKPWSSYAARNGAGIIMKARIRNQHDNSWIVGGENSYELVYAPFPVDELKIGKIYDINLVFGTQYRSTGTPYGYQLSYHPEIKPWNPVDDDVELVRK